MIMKQKTSILDGNEAYLKAKKFMKELMPKNVKKILKNTEENSFIS